jgi:hypothetical protein
MNGMYIERNQLIMIVVVLASYQMQFTQQVLTHHMTYI